MKQLYDKQAVFFDVSENKLKRLQPNAPKFFDINSEGSGGSGDLTLDDVLANGNSIIENRGIESNGKIFSIGDLSGSNTGRRIVVDDISGNIYIIGLGVDKAFNINNTLVSIGDVLGDLGKLTLDPVSPKLIFQRGGTLNPIQIFFEVIDFETRIGDVSHQNNLTEFVVNDDIGQIEMKAKNGVIIPKLTTAERDLISAQLIEGVTIYNTDLHKMQVYDGTTWQSAW